MTQKGAKNSQTASISFDPIHSFDLVQQTWLTHLKNGEQKIHQKIRIHPRWRRLKSSTSLEEKVLERTNSRRVQIRFEEKRIFALLFSAKD